MDHTLVKHENCHLTSCMICDGGLGLCQYCGGFEGSLATKCPGFDIGEEIADMIYKGVVDFTEEGWVFNFGKIRENVKEKEGRSNEEY